MAANTFDPQAHLGEIRTRQGMQPYLAVKWRVIWFNTTAENGSIVTEITSESPIHARFKATVTFAGRTYTGHGSETVEDFPDFFEKAETKAIGRALANAGFGTDLAADFDDGEPLDGVGAAKAERATRRAENAPAPTPPAPRQPEPARISSVRSRPAPPQEQDGAWQPPERVENTAHLVGILNKHYGWNLAADAKLLSMIDDLHQEYQRNPGDLIPFDTTHDGKQTRYPSTVWAWVRERATPSEPQTEAAQ